MDILRPSSRNLCGGSGERPHLSEPTFVCRQGCRSLSLCETRGAGQKIVVTELGYHSAVNSGAQYVTEAVRAKYLARAMVSLATDPDIELVRVHLPAGRFQPDPNNSLKGTKGLISYQLQPKSHFYAVRNMMHILCDNSTPFEVRNLNYDLSGNLADVQTVLYQKTNRAYYLLIWLEKLGMTKDGPINNAPQAVKLSFSARTSIWSGPTGRLRRTAICPPATARGRRSTTPIA